MFANTECQGQALLGKLQCSSAAATGNFPARVNLNLVLHQKHACDDGLLRVRGRLVRRRRPAGEDAVERHAARSAVAALGVESPLTNRGLAGL